MSRLLTNRVATITEMREPHKVLEKAGGQPVAILRNSQCVGYFVPTEVVDQITPIKATREQVLASLKATADTTAPVLDYLKDK